MKENDWFYRIWNDTYGDGELLIYFFRKFFPSEDFVS